MPEYRIGDYTFPSKKRAREAIQEILYSRPHRTPLVGPDYELLGALLGLHHRADEKIGTGISHIEIRTVDFGKPGFWAVRTDGSAVDFSYIRCLDGARTQEAEVKVAMRNAIQPDIDRFRREELHRLRTNGLPMVCELSGNPIGDGPDTHVDHYGADNEFHQIAARFAELQGGFTNIATRSVEIGIGCVLDDDDVFDAWVAFHRANAQLRLIHRSANLQRFRRGA